MTVSDQTPFAIAVAPNGARRGKADHPRLPMTAAEIARDAKEALAAGAAMIHLHVRDEDGRHSLDLERYREAIAAVRDAVGDDLVIQATTEAVGRYTPSEQMALVDALQPESVSVALREIMPDEAGEADGAAFLRRTVDAGILLQIIVYDAAEVARVERLQRDGRLPEGPLALLAVLGRYSEQGATQAEFDAFMATSLHDHQWMLCAFGAQETSFMQQAAAMGGHARVGFENNLRLPDGSVAPDNASIVAVTATSCRQSARPLAKAADLRRNWLIPAIGRKRNPAA